MELKRDEIIQGLRDNDSPYKSDQDSIRDAIAFINELTEENERLRELGTTKEVEKEIVRRETRADTVRKMQTEIEARCIKGGIYPAFVKRTIDQIAEEMIKGETK